jgi:hypothetical protein
MRIVESASLRQASHMFAIFLTPFFCNILPGTYDLHPACLQNRGIGYPAPISIVASGSEYL